MKVDEWPARTSSCLSQLCEPPANSKTNQLEKVLGGRGCGNFPELSRASGGSSLEFVDDVDLHAVRDL